MTGKNFYSDNFKGSPQEQANKNWQENNKERAKYLSNRSRSRNFIKKQATEEDLIELLQLIQLRKQ